MAITKTGIHVDESSSFTNPLVYEENGQVNSIVADSLTPDTRYYTRGYVISDGQTVYSSNIRSFKTEEPDYLTFSNPNNSSITVTLRKNGTPWDITGETSLDDGSTWTTFDFTGVNSQSWLIPAGKKLRFRGNNSNGMSKSASDYYNFSCNSNINIVGNIITLLDKTALLTAIPCSYCFYALFKNMTTLDNEGIVLPHIKLKEGTYNSLFYGCTSLTSMPDLHADPVSAGDDYLFNSAFYGCTSLTSPANLYIYWVVSGIFFQTFRNCTSLQRTAPLTRVGEQWTSYSSIFAGMYQGCTSITETATYFSNGNCNSMYEGCTSLTKININFSNISSLKTYRLFYGCTSLQKIDLSGSAGISNIGNMLSYCSSLKEVKCPNVSTWTDGGSWLYKAGTNVSGTKIVYVPSGLCVGSGTGCIPENSSSGIPTGWTYQTY